MYVYEEQIAKYLTATNRVCQVYESLQINQTTKRYILLKNTVDPTRVKMVIRFTNEMGEYSSLEDAMTNTPVEVTEIHNHRIYFKRMDGRTIDVELPEEFIQSVKDYVLQERVKCELKQLKPAVKRLIKHGFDACGPTTNVTIDVFVLDSIDFEQAYKGTVLIRRRFTDTLKNPDLDNGQDLEILKGYVYSDTNGDIRYETVQSWRYVDASEDPRYIELLHDFFEDAV